MNVRTMMQLRYSLSRGFASKMQAGSTKNNKDSAGRHLGVKKLGGNEVQPGDIIARQRGFKWHPGQNTYVGKDHTIHSRIEGVVQFERSHRAWKLKKKKYIMHVVPHESANKLRRPRPYCYHPELFPERAERNPAPYQLKVNQTIPFTLSTIAVLGRGTKVDNPIHQQFVALSQFAVPKRIKPDPISDQILNRVNRKLQSLVEGEIEISFDKPVAN